MEPLVANSVFTTARDVHFGRSSIVQGEQKVCAPDDYCTNHQVHRDFLITLYLCCDYSPNIGPLSLNKHVFRIARLLQNIYSCSELLPCTRLEKVIHH